MGLIRNRDTHEDDPGAGGPGSGPSAARELDDKEFAALPGDPPPPAPGTTTEPPPTVDPVPVTGAASPPPPPAPESAVNGPPPPPPPPALDVDVSSGDAHDGDGDDDDVATPGGPTKLVTGGPAFQDRWELIQVDFVDDPRAAVSRADGLVGDVVDEIMRALATEREQLAGAWRDDESASTEDLRLAFQRYRTVFQRLLRS